MQAGDLPEVITVDGKHDRQGEQLGLAEQRPEEQLPIVNPFLVNNAQTDDRTRQRQEILEVDWDLDLGRFEFFEEGFDTRVVILGRVQSIDDRPVPFV